MIAVLNDCLQRAYGKLSAIRLSNRRGFDLGDGAGGRFLRPHQCGDQPSCLSRHHSEYIRRFEIWSLRRTGRYVRRELNASAASPMRFGAGCRHRFDCVSRDNRCQEGTAVGISPEVSEKFMTAQVVWLARLTKTSHLSTYQGAAVLLEGQAFLCLQVQVSTKKFFYLVNIGC